LRALIAVGFSRAGWKEVPDEARGLLAKLAASLPTAHLPPATASHTRHYMPPFAGNTTKVFDTFAYVGDGILAFTWDIELEDEERRLLDLLLRATPYLGRAESWVEAARYEVIPPGLDECSPSDSCPGPGLERIALLAPESPTVYAQWRATAVQREEGRSLAELVAKATAKAKAAPKSLGKKDASRIDKLFPSDIVEALLADTKTLQAQRWSQPPGTRWVAYWRPVEALRAPASPPARSRSAQMPTMALLALASDTKRGQVLPSLADALWRLEALHDALVRLSTRDKGTPSPVFSGKSDGRPLSGHQHATLIPLALDARTGRLDHVLVYAPMGFDGEARSALTRLTKTYAKDLPTIFVTLAGLGRRSDFVKLVPAARASRCFRSVTPFVPPRFVKQRGSNTLVEQVQAELERRGLRRADAVEVLPDGGRRFRAFRKARRDAERAPPMRLGVALRLRFAEPVDGPIALGYASHFGLGTFEPDDG